MMIGRRGDGVPRRAPSVRLARAHRAAEACLWAGSCDAWRRWLRGGEACTVPGLAGLPADEAHARELLLDARLVRCDFFLVLRAPQTRVGPRGAVRRRDDRRPWTVTNGQGRGAAQRGKIG